jgi:hypothetical protein
MEDTRGGELSVRGSRGKALSIPANMQANQRREEQRQMSCLNFLSVARGIASLCVLLDFW